MDRRMGVNALEDKAKDKIWSKLDAELELRRRKILPISPSFRLIVLASPPEQKQGT